LAIGKTSFESNANSLLGSAAVTRQNVIQRCHRLRFAPRNLAPTRGLPIFPDHRPEVVSGDHSPILVTSVIKAYTASELAAI